MSKNWNWMMTPDLVVIQVYITNRLTGLLNWQTPTA